MLFRKRCAPFLCVSKSQFVFGETRLYVMFFQLGVSLEELEEGWEGKK